MKTISVIHFFLLITTGLKAQSSKEIAGEYLHGVMETACGFKLNEDSTFQFFFSYGALDRNGEGKWSFNNDSITFNSRKKPEKDFALIKSETVDEDSITIKIIDDNEMMLRHIACILKNDWNSDTLTTDENGQAKFSVGSAESVTLIFEFCPERQSLFSIENADDNYFEFKFEPWAMEVFFENFTLIIGNNQLTGKHPLLTGEEFKYEKE